MQAVHDHNLRLNMMIPPSPLPPQILTQGAMPRHHRVINHVTDQVLGIPRVFQNVAVNWVLVIPRQNAQSGVKGFGTSKNCPGANCTGTLTGRWPCLQWVQLHGGYLHAGHWGQLFSLSP